MLKLFHKGKTTMATPQTPAAPTTEQTVDQIVAVGGAVAESVTPPPIATVIATGVELEPEIYHLLSALIHLFQKQKKEVTT
jgi:hypothetical protein